MSWRSKRSSKNTERSSSTRVTERHLPKTVTLQTLLKPRQVLSNPDKEAREYVESMYSFDNISTYAQRILDSLQKPTVTKKYIRHRFIYDCGFKSKKYIGSVNYPTIVLSSSDFYKKDCNEEEVIEQVVSMLTTRPKVEEVKEIKVEKVETEVDDIFADVGSEYVIQRSTRSTTSTERVMNMFKSDEEIHRADTNVSMNMFNSDEEMDTIDSVQQSKVTNHYSDQSLDSESDDPLPLLFDSIPEQLDSYDYIDSGSEEDEPEKKVTRNLDRELSKVSGVYQQKYGHGLVEDKKRTSELLEDKNRASGGSMKKQKM